MTPPIVTSSVFGILSIREGWDHYLVILACLYGLWTCGSILWEEYSTKFHRKKCKRQESEKPGKPNNSTASSVHILSEPNVESDSRKFKVPFFVNNMKSMNKSLNIPCWFREKELFRPVSHRIIRCGINGFCKLFGVFGRHRIKGNLHVSLPVAPENN